jgi:3-oxoacyl-[acyl-carrier protein] reductase
LLRSVRDGLGALRSIGGDSNRIFYRGKMSGVVLITGSNGGIGSAVAEYLLAKGERNLAFHYRSDAQQIKALICRYDLDPEKYLFKADLCNEEELGSLRQRIEERFGTVWGLVNVAGASSNAMSWKMTVSDFRKIIDDNLTATFLSCREFIPGMRSDNSGRIINFSSIVASTGVAGASHYCAAKGGIESFTKAISLELAPKNITANTIALGFFEYGLIHHLSQEVQREVRERIPLKRFGVAADIGSYIGFLLSPESTFTTGQVLHVNGGQY